MASISIPFGDIVFTFVHYVDAAAADRIFPWAGPCTLVRGDVEPSASSVASPVFTGIDHATLVVPLGALAPAVAFLVSLGFRPLAIDSETESPAEPSVLLVDTGVTGSPTFFSLLFGLFFLLVTSC
jgi:hypothetical protein